MPYCIYYRFESIYNDYIYYPIGVINKIEYNNVNGINRPSFKMSFNFIMDTIKVKLHLSINTSTKYNKRLIDDFIKTFEIFISSLNDDMCGMYDFMAKVYNKINHIKSDNDKIIKFIDIIKSLIKNKNYYNDICVNKNEEKFLDYIKNNILIKDPFDILYFQNQSDKKMYKINDMNEDMDPVIYGFKKIELIFDPIETILNYICYCNEKNEKCKNEMKKIIMEFNINIFFDNQSENYDKIIVDGNEKIDLNDKIYHLEKTLYDEKMININLRSKMKLLEDENYENKERIKHLEKYIDELNKIKIKYEKNVHEKNEKITNIKSKLNDISHHIDIDDDMNNNYNNNHNNTLNNPYKRKKEKYEDDILRLLTDLKRIKTGKK